MVDSGNVATLIMGLRLLKIKYDREGPSGELQNSA